MLLLLLGLAASGLPHAMGGGYVPADGSRGIELTVPIPHGGEPCCPDHDGQPIGTGCSGFSGCALWVPLASWAVLDLTGQAPVEAASDAIPLGGVLPPHFRPPKLPRQART